ncbi:hypothetical protein [Echinicola sp. 20G]|uniref:hypothetical protein n=1 Tax=Echinicola sp. 20G TaxID=2781961 RepID=UPI001910DCE2|nr:hypothetical protein [Echinicola sp. 20G]
MKKSIGIFLAVLVLLGSCTKDDEQPNGQQSEKPTMPPESSMAPDMTMFDDQGSEGSREIAVGNWAYAAINVGVYSMILYSHLAVPVTAFKATVDVEAVYNESQELWVWEKGFQVEGKGSYEVRLTADVDGQEVAWTGYISGEGVNNFVWFTGTSKLNGEMGAWELYESPSSSSVWLSNSWEYDHEAAKGTTTFTVEKEGENKGSSITYGVDGSMDMDRSVMINNVSSGDEIYVNWSKEGSYGRVMSEMHFDDELYHCWDASLQDTQCE